MLAPPKVRFVAQNWSKDQGAVSDALKLAQELLSQVPEGRVVSADPGSMLVEAAAPKAADATRLQKRLEKALPGWSIFPETRYRLVG